MAIVSGATFTPEEDGAIHAKRTKQYAPVPTTPTKNIHPMTEPYVLQNMTPR